MTTPPSKQLDQFVVRLPDGMRERIRLAADANNRSMNAEIVARLESSFDLVLEPIIEYRSLKEMRDVIDQTTEFVRNPKFQEVLKSIIKANEILKEDPTEQAGSDHTYDGNDELYDEDEGKQSS